MTPFRLSFTARLLSAAASLLLAGSGIAVLAGFGHAAVPVVLMAGIGAGIVALVVGALDYPIQVLLAAVLLPMVLWPYVMVLEWIATENHAFAWPLIIAGAVPAVATFVAPLVRKPSSETAPKTA